MIYLKNTRFFELIVISLLLTFSMLLMLPDMALHADVKQTEDVILGPGDAIRVLVWDGRQTTKETSYLSNFNRDFALDGKGDIRLLTLGEVHLGGLNAEEVSKILTEKFRFFAKEPIVVVIPLIRVTLYGAFRRPGTYRLPPQTAFWQLVDEAGGPTKSINFERIRVERKGKIVIENFLAAFEEAHSLQEVGIRSGDQIFAPEQKKLTFREFVSYFNFAASTIMLYLTFQNYRVRR